MVPIEFRRRRSEDELVPYYVRIAEPGDEASLAFTVNTNDPATLDAAISALRAGRITIDRLHDRANDKWFFRFMHADTGDLLFRSMPCDDEAAAEERISRIQQMAPDAPIIDDTQI